jgi:hypothetical protein
VNRVQKCSNELHEAMTASGLIKPTPSCMVDSVVGLSCAVCGSKKGVDYHSVGNVGISQSLPLCESCKPNAANEPCSEAE